MTFADSLTELHDPVLMRAQARVGRVLRGKWQLDRLLGVGGMAAVYAASHRNGKTGAIKMLHSELSVDVQIRERFLREGRAANHVGHPGAVSVLDDDIAEDGSIFLVMDLLEGESVESRRSRGGGRLDAADVLSIIDQVLDVLAAAHAKGIVHRDLKPDNLFVTREGAVKVLDFGIAKLRESATANATHTGVSMGTPSFMAQEQARALWDEVDARTDLWAVGATMFTCLTGRTVHEGRTANEQLLSAMTRPALPLLHHAPTAPPSVAAVVDRALAFAREDRFQSAAEMQGAVRAAYQAMQSGPISSAPRLVVPATGGPPTLLAAGEQVRGEPQRTGEPVTTEQGGPTARRPSSVRAAAVGLGALAAVGATLVSIRASSPQVAPSTAPAATSVDAMIPPASASADSPTPEPVALPPEPASSSKPDKARARTAPPARLPVSPSTSDPFDRRGK